MILSSVAYVMSSVWSAVRRYAWLCLFVVGTLAIAAVVLVARFRTASRETIPMPSPVEAIKAELESIRAEGRLERLVAEKERDAAVAQIELAYQEQRHELEISERNEAERLRADPAELANFLARAGARKARP